MMASELVLKVLGWRFLPQEDLVYLQFYMLNYFLGKFNWKGTIKAVLKQAPDNEISIKKLRKKVQYTIFFFRF